MKLRNSAAIALAAISALSMNVSCLKETAVETSPQAVIRSLTLGNFYVETNDVNYQRHDTVVYSYQGGVMYPLTIDQLNNRIYNVDSLALGSIVSSVTCKYSGVGNLLYRYLDDDTAADMYNVWTDSDPIDFTRPLKFFVLSTDKSYMRGYDFKLNIHKVHPDSVSWVASDTVGYTVLERSTAAVLDNTLYNMGLNAAGIPAVATHDTRNGNWNAPVAMTGLDGTAWTGSVSLFGGSFLTVCGGQLFSSSDALSWTLLKPGVSAIVSAGQGCDALWVKTDDGKLIRTEDLSTWTSDQDIPAGFPDSIAGAFTYPLATNASISRTVMAGLKDGTPAVWTVLSNDNLWKKVESAPYSKNPIPSLQSFSIIRYDGSLFAFGAGFTGFWQSIDNGANWLWCDRYFEDYSSYNNYMQFPEGLKGNMSAFSYATDGLGCIWIMTENGQVWRGSINRLNRR